MEGRREKREARRGRWGKKGRVYFLLIRSINQRFRIIWKFI